MTPLIDYPVWDADNHYYETRDCFTRHMEPGGDDHALRPVVLDDGKEVWVVGDRQLMFPVTKFDKCEPPGALKAILTSTKFARFEEARSEDQMIPAFRDRKARLDLMDEQGLEAAILLPTNAIGWEMEVVDPADIYPNVRSFNRWLEEVWGFGTEGRIWGVPVMSLADAGQAIAEFDRLIGAGAQLLYLHPGPPLPGRSLVSPELEPFWARVNETGTPIILHAGVGFLDQSAYWGENPTPGVRELSAFQWAFYQMDRPIMETLGAMVYNNLFARFPNLRILSIENGSNWLPYFMKGLNKGAKMGRYGPWPGGPLTERPTDILKRHLWLAPYPEDDPQIAVDALGAERVLFGSDFPHPEGMARPTEFADGLTNFDQVDVQRIMRDNLRDILAPSI